MKMGQILILLGVAMSQQVGAEESLAHKYIIADGHIDVPYRLEGEWADVTRATEGGDFDLPRAKAGGLDLPFMSIYTPAEMEADGGSYQLANQLIDSVEALVARAPGDFALAYTPGDALRARESGRIALAMGMENGTPIEGELENVGHFRKRGISYITLAHSLSNHISDSSYDKERPNGGLSDFGREVVREMNRWGVMVDVSHISDEAFWDVLEVSEVPVIASHSSARHFTPGFERNMSDDMIRALGEKGGVIMINFGSSFVTEQANSWFLTFAKERSAWLEANGFEADSPQATEFGKSYRETNPFPFATLDEVVAHFDHVIKIAGVKAVGIGSDYDGVGDSLPIGLKDVSTFPTLVEAFQRKGYSEEDIALILGGNLMRVWSATVGHTAGR